MVKRPVAPANAVNQIVRTMRGRFYPGGDGTYTTASFKDAESHENAYRLLNMLIGWKAEPDPDAPLVLRVWRVAEA